MIREEREEYVAASRYNVCRNVIKVNRGAIKMKWVALLIDNPFGITPLLDGVFLWQQSCLAQVIAN